MTVEYILIENTSHGDLAIGSRAARIVGPKIAAFIERVRALEEEYQVIKALS
jgi:hypothetical protein